MFECFIRQEEKRARDRVRAQIEADKAARREQMAALTGKATAPAPSAPIPVTADSTSKAPKAYTSTRIQVRLANGTTLVETFDVKEPLSAVRLFVQLKHGTDEPFAMMTTFPRKVYDDEDFEKPLEALGLVPSAVLIVTKAK